MSDDQITPEILELILRTSRIKSCKDIYSLAPRGHRVGLYFQQRRATLLAAAIRCRLGPSFLQTCRIGIIGGGIAGLTFLSAISHEGAEDVTLYEATDRLLKTGADAPHRLVHPNYNRWPLLGSMDAFTTLPVLNWYAGSAESVMGQLVRQIQNDSDQLLRNCVKKSHRITRVTHKGDGYTNPLEVVFDTPTGEKGKSFDIVVIAAGFSSESGAKWGFNDYWTESTDDYDIGHHRRACTVYGVGDGGLIDILRSCTKQPNNAWLIPLGTIARLRPEAASTLQVGLRSGEIEPRGTSFSPFEKKIQAHEESIRCVAWAFSTDDEAASDSYALEEELFYRAFVRDMHERRPSVFEFIEEQLKPVASDNLRPVLVGTRRYAFEPTSAPINKILLAHLFETKRIVYSQQSRDAQREELERRSRLPAFDRRSEITICRYGAIKNFPLGPRGDPPPYGIEVIVNPGTVVETKIESHLIDAFASVTGGEYIYFDAMPHPLSKARFGPGGDDLLRNTRIEKTRILREFAKEHLQASNVRYVDGSTTEESSRVPEEKVLPRWVILTTLKDRQITENLMAIGGLDGNFFGLPIVVSGQMSSVGDEF